MAGPDAAASAVKTTNDDLEVLHSLLEKSRGGLNSFSNALGKSKSNVEAANKAIKAAGHIAKAAAKETESAAKGYKSINIAMEEYKKSLGDLAKQYGIIRHAADLDIKSKEEIKKVSRAIRAASEEERKTLQKLSGEYKLFGNLGSKIKSQLFGAVAAFGATTISLGELTKSLIEYRATQFSISRSQQVFGTGLNDLAKGMEYAKKNTILSNRQFATMVDTFQKGYIGATKSATEIAKIGKVLQTAFGPNIDEIKARAQDLLGIMNKFPALGKMIQKAGELAQIGGDEKELAKYKAMILSTGTAIGLSAQEWDTVAKMTTKATAEQQKQQLVAEKIAKAQQYFSNAMIKAAEYIESAVSHASDLFQRMTWVGTIAKKVLGAFEEYPIALGATLLALTKIGALWKVIQNVRDSRILNQMRGNASAGSEMSAMGKGRGILDSIAPSALGRPGSPMHVYVTNAAEIGASSSGGGLADAVSNVGGKAGKVGRLGRWAGRAKSALTWGGRAASVIGLAGAGVSYLGGMAKDSGYRKTGQGMQVGGGALSGAAIGSMAGPLGTAAGAAIGGGIAFYRQNADAREEEKQSLEDLTKQSDIYRKRNDALAKTLKQGVGIGEKQIKQAKALIAMYDRETKMGVKDGQRSVSAEAKNLATSSLDPKNIEQATKAYKEFAKATWQTTGVFVVQKQMAEMLQNLEQMKSIFDGIKGTVDNVVSASDQLNLANQELLTNYLGGLKSANELMEKNIGQTQQAFFQQGGALDKMLPTLGKSIEGFASEFGLSVDKLRSMTSQEFFQLGGDMMKSLADSIKQKDVPTEPIMEKVRNVVGLGAEQKKQIMDDIKKHGADINAAQLSMIAGGYEADFKKQTIALEYSGYGDKEIETSMNRITELKEKMLNKDSGSNEQYGKEQAELQELVAVYGLYYQAYRKMQTAKEQAADVLSKQEAELSIVKETGKMAEKALDPLKEAERILRTTISKTADQQMAYNSVVEQRINMERELMEAAQFGMGASIDMMQQQVDLQMKIMQNQKTSVELADKEIAQALEKKGLSGGALKMAQKELQQANNREAVDAILSKYGISKLANGKVDLELQTQIVAATDERNKRLTMQMQAQKKIYDLTKEMREGYLDAVREMAWGAGEFEKIIGTQEMGVTQLMGAVNSFSDSGQQNMLNTMKLGGLQGRDMTMGGVGTQYSGQYTVGGARFENKDETNAKNRRIYGYQDSMDRYRDMASGKATVGTGVAGDVTTDTANAIRDGGYDGTYQGVKDAIKDTGVLTPGNIPNRGSPVGSFNGVNPGVVDNGRTNGFRDPVGQGGINPGNVMAFGVNQARNAQAQAPANPPMGFKGPTGATGQGGVAGTPLSPTPPSQRKYWGTWWKSPMAGVEEAGETRDDAFKRTNKSFKKDIIEQIGFGKDADTEKFNEGEWSMARRGFHAEFANERDKLLASNPLKTSVEWGKDEKGNKLVGNFSKATKKQETYDEWSKRLQASNNPTDRARANRMEQARSYGLAAESKRDRLREENDPANIATNARRQLYTDLQAEKDKKQKMREDAAKKGIILGASDFANVDSNIAGIEKKIDDAYKPATAVNAPQAQPEKPRVLTEEEKFNMEAQDLRNKWGDKVKPKENQTMQQALQKKGYLEAIQSQVWELPDAEQAKQQKLIQKAATLKYGTPTEKYKDVATIEGGLTASGAPIGGHTSEADRKGLVADKVNQAAFGQTMSSGTAEIAGLSTSEESGGTGNANISITLAPDLRAKVDASHGVTVSIKTAASGPK